MTIFNKLHKYPTYGPIITRIFKGRKPFNNMNKRLNFLKFPGGGFYTAPWVVSNMPQNYEKMKYAETHLGGGSVFFYKNPSQMEILNDLNPEITTLFRRVRDDVTNFINELSMFSYSEQVFQLALENRLSSAEVITYCKYRMSRGGLGKTFAWSERLRGGKPGDINAFETAIKKLPLIQDRLKNTIITNYDARDIIQFEDSPNTLMVIDPPWVKSTRVSKDIHENFEMSEKDHEHLATSLNNAVGKVMLLGYKSDLYNRLYPAPKWRIVEKELPTHAGQSKKKTRRIVTLWLNY